MATNLTDTTLSTTYKDDFKDSDNYHRVLFNSGKALQARELTQLQTIIQSEITRMGNNLYKEGAKISGGDLTLNNTREFIKLAAGELANLETSNIIGTTFTVKAPDAGIKVKVLKIVSASGSDPDTLYVEYVDTSAGTSGSSPIRVPNGAVLDHPTQGAEYDLTVASSNATGRGLEVSIPKASFYVQGRFVFVEQQSVFVSKYTTDFTGEVGFKLEQKIITATDNDALYDNQGASPNLAAPGADRLQIKLTLVAKDTLSAGENFIYLTKIVNGKLADQAGVTSPFAEIEKDLAKRTKEESGDYIVKQFVAQFDELNDSNLQLSVTPGIAYVDGFRLEVDKETLITVPKAQDTVTKDNETVVVQYGNYVLTDASNNKGVPNVNTFQKYDLNDATNYGGNVIGTARTRHVEEDGANIRLYLFDIRMNSGKSFSAVRSIGTSASEYNNLILEDSVAVLKNTAQNDLLFPLPSTRPTQTGITADTITYQKRYTFTTDGSGASGTVAVGGSGQTFTSSGQWVVSRTGGAIDTTGTITLAGDQLSFTITGLDNSTAYEVSALVAKSSPSSRSKTLTNTTISKVWPTDAESDGNGTQFISLDKADIFSVESIKVNDSDGADISSNWIIDNGQRDNYYGIGRIIPKGGTTPSNGTIFSRFKHFTHGAGEFFDATSYNAAAVSYDKIPSHRQNNGEVIQLRDVMDFRPVAIKAGTHQISFDSNGAGGDPLINALPQNTDTFTADIVYYLSRADRLILTSEQIDNTNRKIAKVRYIQGKSSETPVAPESITGALSLYSFTLNPFTLNDSDLSSTRNSAKRFTMEDIADLENRIANLEELTTLSLLELDTTSLSVVDSAGLDRTKAGFLVDNFYNYDFSADDRSEYRAVIDDAKGLLTPEVFAHHCALTFDSTHDYAGDGLTEAVRKGDNLYLPIDSDVLFLNQNLATETENINPFAVIRSRGHITLSPETDNWFETKRAPSIEVSGGTVNRTRIVRNAGALRRNWIGIDANGEEISFRDNTPRRTVTRDVTTRREVIDNRVIDISIIPFMRSIQVYFDAKGLRPNTKHFPYFGGKDISDYAREESLFRRWSTRTDTNRLYGTNTAHPSGSSNLVSDSNGDITGSFIIPGTNSLKFRTGSVEFKLLDINSGVDSDAASSAITLFTSSGLLTTNQQTIRSTRVVNRTITFTDPLAQSFLVNSVEHPNGLFLTKVRIHFATKAANGGTPVECSIVPMIAGVPDVAAIPGATKVLTPANVNVPGDLDSISSVRSAGTDFEFDEPVFLSPGTDYAVVLKAETTDYTVYVAKTNDFLLGSTESRINKQPTLGSLFLSQNASTWTPDQERDLMFGLFHAQFQTSAAAIINNITTPKVTLGSNPLLTESAGDEVRVSHEGHGFIKNDRVTITGLDSASYYAGLRGVDIMGSRQITKVDHTGYTFNADSNFTSRLNVGGDGVIATQNQMFNSFVPQVSSVLPNLTTLDAKIKLTEGASYANNRNTASGYSRAKASTFTTINLNDLNLTNSPKAIFSDSNESVSPLSGAKSLTMQLDMTTADNKVSPVIDLQRMSMTMFENIIDKQDSSATSGFNVPISIVQETHPTDGTSAAKHVTKTVTLAEPAVGLKILFAANRPSASRFRVFFKTGTSDDNLDNINFIEIAENGSNPADENSEVFRQYEYLPGGQVGNLSSFTQFQIKIVMESTNSSKIPTIKDLRAIALVT
jgi:hypothetical protein